MAELVLVLTDFFSAAGGRDRGEDVGAGLPRLPLLETLAADRGQPAIALSALISIGKISRNPKAVDALVTPTPGDTSVRRKSEPPPPQP